MNDPKSLSTSTGTRRDKQKAETNALILAHAKRLFEQRGFDETTIRDVASAAGVGLGTIFGHFPDKKALFVTSIVDDIEAVNERAAGSMPASGTTREKMLHLARAGYEGWFERPSLSRVLIREMCFSTGPAFDRLRALDRQAVVRVTRLLEEAQATGELRADAEPLLAAQAVFSFYLTTVLRWLADEDLAGPEKQRGTLDGMVEETRRFLNQLFDGIGGDAGDNGEDGS